MLDEDPEVATKATRRHPYLSGNFAPVRRTYPLTPCPYQGNIPDDLAGGQYVRNGSNPLANEDLARDAHWFDGDGMLCGVLFRRIDINHDNGSNSTEIQPEFVNQFLITDVYRYTRTSRALKRPLLPSIATLVNPAAPLLRTLFAVARSAILVILSHLLRCPTSWPIRKISVANTAVIYHDGRALATCESGPPLRFLLPGLETVGWFNGVTAENQANLRLSSSLTAASGFGGDDVGVKSFVKEWTTAHPRVDPSTGELIAFHSVPIPPFVYYSIIGATESKSGITAKSTAPRSRFSLPVPGVTSPKMMHDFGVSRGHTIIMDLPLSLDPLNLIRGRPTLSYDPAGRSRFGVFPRYRPDRVRWFETGPCCIFHVANCWDTVGRHETHVHLLACRMTTPFMVLSAGNLPLPTPRTDINSEEDDQCRLYYFDFALPTTTGIQPSISHQWALTAIPLEFPTQSPFHAMGPSRFIYGCSSSTASLTTAAKINIIAKIDVQALIARGCASPPESGTGCVDTRTVAEILADNSNTDNDDDPIRLFRMPQGWFAQEARFVPRPLARQQRGEADQKREGTAEQVEKDMGEDDGWLLTFVFDESQLNDAGECPDDAAGELWIIDAKWMRDVVARVRLPQRVPYGFHGAWFSEEEIRGQRGFERVREDVATERRDDVEGFWGAVRDTVERWVG